MPFIFVHGVNTRKAQDDPGNPKNSYEKDETARTKLIRSKILLPLGSQVSGAETMNIVSPYWGHHGAKFRWNLASVPKTKYLDDLGPDSGTPLSDSEFIEMLGTIPAAYRVEPQLEQASPLKRAAREDLSEFLQIVLAPILTGEWPVLVDEDEPSASGNMEAELLLVADDVAHDVGIVADVARASTDEALTDLLEFAIRTRLRERLRGDRSSTLSEIDEYGEGMFSRAAGRVSDLFDRVKDRAARFATVPFLAHFRPDLHLNLARFVGDVFQYLREREGSGDAGYIVREVLSTLREATRMAPNGEPLIVMTHSMGGNIFYDIVTHYATDLVVDAWISVGTQVGQLEEMKFFCRSNPDVAAPERVGGVKPSVRYWLNVYDPADPFAFLAEPIFADVEDVRFKTGSSVRGSHSAYFVRPEFYDLVAEKLKGALDRR